MQKKLYRLLGLIFGLLLLFSYAQAATSTVNLNSEAQIIKGFGGMNFPRWIGTLTDAQVDKAYVTGNGQIGLTIMRISVPPNSGDWSGEVAAAKRAQQNYGALIVASPWSPPASMKTNGSTTHGSLKTSSYADFANYLSDFYSYMSNQGVSLYAISVQNEPDWDPDYESCTWTGEQMRIFLDNNASVIPTKVIAPETVHYNSSWMDPVKNSSQCDIVGTHLYGGTITALYGKEYWMTEHLENNTDWSGALQTGKEIHDCMMAAMSAYVWWYTRRSYGPLDENGNITKRGYVMSHFAKFVRPGFHRIDATSNPASGVYVSAYKDGNTVVVVAINQNYYSSDLTLSFSGNAVADITKWQTTSSGNLQEVATYSGGSSLTSTLAENSINTFRGTTGDSSCTPTSITAYLQVEGGSWQQSSSATVNSGDEVIFGPQPARGGSWSWSGCGTSGSSREQTIYPASSCAATATYTNDCGAQSSQDFNITVGLGGSTHNYRLRARSTDGQGNVNLIVDNQIVASWTLGTDMGDYTVNNVDLYGAIEVEFDNDAAASRDVQIDYLSVDGDWRQAEDQDVNTGVWQNSSCGGSYSEWLHCNGVIEFGTTP